MDRGSFLKALVLSAALVAPSCGGGGGNGKGQHGSLGGNPGSTADPGNVSNAGSLPGAVGTGDFGPAFTGTPAIAFLSFKNSTTVRELFAANSTGSTLRNLSGPIVAGGTVGWFTWSPDRSRIVFEAEKEVAGTREIYAVASTGGVPLKLHPNLAAGRQSTEATVSPDNTKVAYIQDRTTAGNGQVWVSAINSAAGNVMVSGAVSFVDHVDWAPDSTHILFQAAPSALCIVKSDGTGLTYLNLGGYSPDFFWRWSPDGARVMWAMQNTTTGKHTLWTANIDGTNQVQVSGNYAWPSTARWSPDGSRLLWLELSDPDLRVGLPDGTGKVVIPVAGATILSGEWSPDGSRIAYNTNNSGLWTCAPDGSDPVNVSEAINGAVAPLLWTNDSTRVLYACAGYQGGSTAVMASSLKATVGLTALSQESSVLPTFPVLSPDGSRVAYRMGLAAGTFDLFSSPVDGSVGMQRHSSTPAGTGSSQGMWALDNTRIFYRSDQDVAGQFDIYSADPAGGPNTKISGTVISGGGTTMMKTK